MTLICAPSWFLPHRAGQIVHNQRAAVPSGWYFTVRCNSQASGTSDKQKCVHRRVMRVRVCCVLGSGMTISACFLFGQKCIFSAKVSALACTPRTFLLANDRRKNILTQPPIATAACRCCPQDHNRRGLAFDSVCAVHSIGCPLVRAG